MNEKTKNDISAFIDGELSADDLERLSGALAESDELRGMWGRYQLIGDALRGEKTDPSFLQVADRVRVRLQDEPTVLAPRPRGADFPRWAKPVAGAALAASVAAAAVLLLPQGLAPPLQMPRQAAALDTGDGVILISRGGTRWQLEKDQPALENRLNGYLVNHRNRAPTANMQGMIPYASFVAYDQGR